MQICSIDRCSRTVYARSWCNAHYVRWQKYGDVTVDLRRQRRIGEAERFWSFVEKTESCWNWKGSCNVDGYGKFWAAGGRTVRPHRWAYEALVGPIPEGLQIDHLCRNRACVRPEHLEAVTGKENTGRGSRAMATHCKHGHEFTPENTYVVKPNKRLPHGGRGCLACRHRHIDRWNAAKRAGLLENPHPTKRRTPSEKCRNGHPYTPENTYLAPPSPTLPNGGRRCRTCAKNAQVKFQSHKVGR